jgi:LEA14-like dessication related protein
LYSLIPKDKTLKALRKKIWLSLVYIFIFTAAAVSASSEQELKISLKETAVKDFNLSGLSLVFFLTISNSSSSPCFLSGYDYRFVVNQKEYFHLANSLEGGIEIEAKKDNLISFPLKISYANLFAAVAGIEKEDKAHCYFSGTMIFTDGKKEMERFPFAFSAEFPIFKKPEVEFHSLKVKDLTIGGADLDFELSFKNSNSYELFIDNISYIFDLGEKRVGEGTIRGDKNVEGRGEKAFSLPFLFNFFDVGKEVYYTLHQASASCRLRGEIEVRTVWGNLKIPFDKRGNVPVSKVS